MRMRNLLLFSFLVLLFSACGGDNDDPVQPRPEPEVEKAPLTILAYLVANNNLDDELLVNIGAMYDGLSDLDVAATLLVYWDGKTSIGNNGANHLILRYETDGKGNINGLPPLEESASMDEVLEVAEIVKEYPSQLSTDKGVMARVLQDMVKMSPTEKVGLITGSHGSAWLNSIYTSGRSFGQDGSGTDNTILIPDFAAAMEATGKKFDFLLFDACYMATAEVCYSFKEVADYQIASVMEVPAYGFPYDLFMKHLFKGTVDGYTQVCQQYVDYYKYLYEETTHQSWATVSLIASEGMDAMVAQLNAQIVEHKDILAKFDTSGLQEYGKSNGKYIAYDMEQFVKQLNEGEVPAAFKTQLDNTILYKGCLEEAYPASHSVDADNYCGLGIYIPVSARPKWNAWFKEMDWFVISGWNEVEFTWGF